MLTIPLKYVADQKYPLIKKRPQDDDTFISKLAELATAIKDAGGVACIQLRHGSRKTSSMMPNT
jgi:2,4-dienoyl-CoA reductase-like NADH-dependent reductase (Old Yellow Enzyme family)